MKNYYQIPTDFEGKTLNQIGDLYGLGGLTGIADLFGISNQDPLKGGQNFGFNTPAGVNPSGSSEFQVLNKYFERGESPEDAAARTAKEEAAARQAEADARNAEASTTRQDAINQAIAEAQAGGQNISNTLNTANQQAINTLESNKAPLKQRYDDIINSIKGTADLRTKQAETATAQEYGKRGIPLTSGVYDTALQNARLPIDTALAQSLADIGLKEQQGLTALDQAIASIQQSGGRDQAQNALAILQIVNNAKSQGISLEESARQFNENQRLQNTQIGIGESQFAQNLGLQREQLSQAEQQFLQNLDLQKKQFEEQQFQFRNPQDSGDNLSLSDRFKIIGEGSSLIDLLTGQSIFDKGKTYKQDGGGGGGGDPAGIL